MDIFYGEKAVTYLNVDGVRTVPWFQNYITVLPIIRFLKFIVLYFPWYGSVIKRYVLIKGTVITIYGLILITVKILLNAVSLPSQVLESTRYVETSTLL